MRELKVVSAVHFSLLGAMLIVSAVHAFVRRKPADEVVPVFLVEVPEGEEVTVVEEDAAPPEPEMVVPQTPQPVPAVLREEKKAAEPKTQKKPVAVNKKKVVRRGMGGPSKRPPTMSEEEIRRLLNRGARPSTRTYIPDASPEFFEDARCFELIRRTLYQMWSQPSAEAIGERPVEVTIELLEDGTITGWEILHRSGSTIMDGSVEQALKTVGRVAGVSREFVKRHRVVTVSFKVGEEAG
jgi:TonB family protein